MKGLSQHSVSAWRSASYQNEGRGQRPAANSAAHHSPGHAVRRFLPHNGCPAHSHFKFTGGFTHLCLDFGALEISDYSLWEKILNWMGERFCCWGSRLCARRLLKSFHCNKASNYSHSNTRVPAKLSSRTAGSREPERQRMLATKWETSLCRPFSSQLCIRSRKDRCLRPL